ncbi:MULTISPECIES: hypothetical protein [Microbacterium]|uniref:hypothetical protein n=1 Tax=Microbacterium TaxID=33882 RepID=UPI0005ACD4BF|nr:MULTISPECIES: hypothetical protein [Microbacterium]AQY02747.1 hypothetical protein B2G67_15695 [Microbacterium foliorum]KIP89092.1 hypothetical protein RU09_13925 [Microbacterium sp. MEJ108Y]
MPISSDRPDCFRLPAVDAAAIRTRPDQLHLVPPDSAADASAIIESHRRARVARGRSDAIGCLVPIAGGLLLAVVAGVVIASLRLPFRDAAIAVGLLFVLGAVVTAVIASRARPTALTPKPLPSVLIHPLVVAGAPADLTARDIELASQVLDERDRADADLRKARADAQLTDEERYVSPGDRSTWYFRPEDLPGLERTADDAEKQARAVADRLGIVLGSDGGSGSAPEA